MGMRWSTSRRTSMLRRPRHEKPRSASSARPDAAVNKSTSAAEYLLPWISIGPDVSLSRAQAGAASRSGRAARRPGSCGRSAAVSFRRLQPARIAREPGAPRKLREGTKQEQFLGMLRRPEGATVAQIADAAG
ncbi:DUF3489 domain-containing protein [Roseomonas rosulenta]|uniref:DUF3489 domain-containing protein n=1 Tax=Roseomonas rosulenta TaxID=2748667 RepID=UPI002105EBAD|nr:DUF3489 domain-containing protein [Roseomonas rosulenta]